MVLLLPRWFLLWFGLLLALARPAVAQSTTKAPRPFPFDSLRATVQQPGLPDTVRVYRALEAYQALIYARPDSAPRYVAQALALAKRIGFLRGQANAYGALAGLDYQAHRYANAQRYYQLEMQTARRARLPLMEATTYASMADMALNTGNVALGLRYYGQARTIFAQARPRSYNYEVWTLCNMAEYYLKHRQMTPAVPLVRQAAALLSHCTWPELPVATAINLGQVQAHQHQPDSAVSQWKRAARLALAAHLDQLAAQAHGLLGRLYLSQHRPAPALAEARLALALARRSHSTADEATNVALLAQAMHAQRQPAAFDTLQRLLVLRDTLHAQENAAALSQAQARFHDNEQQARIRNLEQDKRLNEQAIELARLRYRQQVGGLSALVLLALALGGGLFWQYRRRAAKRQAAREMTLRSRLAADLHNDVGSLLSQISQQSDLLREAKAEPAQTLARLTRLSETSRRAARQMADVVWSLRTTSAELPEVVEHMREHAHEVLPPAGLSIDFGVSDEAAALRPSVAVCQTLYLNYKEALHNVVKHARGATQVTVRLTLQAGQLCLSVHDNAPTKASATSRGGLGLANMRQRSEALGGTLRLETETPGFGVVSCLPG
ncbi:ATP-binding protein [Hymenobacter rubidus]|uniref:ATP-binding protein n=1 Tax=Hymenobacter rubidus TaxID=1441626 RepID=UPI0019201380|nr:ATP-binding protein [Hymenobacter rubidus]